MPPTAFNRLGDNWRPLFAIAQVAGGDWPRRALEAFNHLNPNQEETDALGILLLADIRQIFTQSGKDRISSAALVEGLRELPDSQWRSRLGPSRSAYYCVGRQLQRFGIKSRALRINGETVKGYALADLTQAISIWLQS